MDTSGWPPFGTELNYYLKVETTFLFNSEYKLSSDDRTTKPVISMNLNYLKYQLLDLQRTKLFTNHSKECQNDENLP